MFKIINVLAITILLTGCATYQSSLRHPETGDMEVCSETAFGLIPMHYARKAHDKCVSSYVKNGYKKID